MSLAPWPVALQPWNQLIFPPPPDGLVEAPMSVTRARSIPGVARALQLIAGMARQMPLNAYRGEQVLPRPRLLEQPDPESARSWWVGVQIEDYLVSGNALQYVTSWGDGDRPASVMWLPADWTSIVVDPSDNVIGYWYQGVELDKSRVIHVRRGAHPMCTARGMGVVEQHLQSLGRVADEESYESKSLKQSGVPSVAVITPNPHLSTDEAVAAKDVWEEKFAGPARRPAILPAGSQVIPLSWSPKDSEMTEARKQSLADVANMFNLDGYWLGAPAGSFTYRTPGPMYLNLIRQTVGPILEDFEGTWSPAWLGLGEQVRFDRIAVLKDDLPTMIQTMDKAVAAGLVTMPEARAYLGYTAELPDADPTPADLKLRADAVAILIRSGFQPESAVEAVGLDPIEHLGLLPVTVQRPDNVAPDAITDTPADTDPELTPEPEPDPEQTGDAGDESEEA